jgi:hypothetical protein
VVDVIDVERKLPLPNTGADRLLLPESLCSECFPSGVERVLGPFEVRTRPEPLKDCTGLL